ncbi:MAG: hypothetical protein WBZ36_26820, partial [Candidatus Nitrosopolaris sp.]
LILSDVESKMLFEILFGRKISKIRNERFKKISVIFCWPPSQQPSFKSEKISPNLVFLYIANGLSVRSGEKGYVELSFNRKLSKHTSGISKTLDNFNDVKKNGVLLEKFQTTQKFDPLEILKNGKFQNKVLSGKNIAPFFQVNKNQIRISLMDPHMVYNQNTSEDYQREIMDFCGFNLEGSYNVSIWFFLVRALKRSLVFLHQIYRPNFDSLAESLCTFRMTSGETWKYDQIFKQFISLFPGIKFEALEDKTIGSRERPFVIKITEKSGREFRLQDGWGILSGVMYFFGTGI